MYTNKDSGYPRGSEKSVDEIGEQTDTMKSDALET